MKILSALMLFITIFFTMPAPVSSFVDPCADGSCAPPDPCADGSCAPVCEETLLYLYRCSGNDRQRLKQFPGSDCLAVYEKIETCAYGCNEALAICNPKPVCEGEEKLLDSYRCSPNGLDRQRERQKSDCSKEWVTLETCTYGCQRVFVDQSLPVGCAPPPEEICYPVASCAALGCGNYDSCGSFCGSCPPPAVVDNAPTAAINVPASAAPNLQLNIVVTGTDDKDVAQLQLYGADSNLLETFDCAGIQTSCSHTFTRTAPSTFSTSYAFKARSKDSAAQLSGFVSGSGTTTAAPAREPQVDVSAQLIQKPGVSLRLPLQPLFMRSVSFQDSDCVRPGESALLAVKVRNTGKSALKAVSFAATVPELGVRARSGPHTIKAADKLTRFLRIDVPEDTAEGAYYLRLTVTSLKFSRAVYRAFTVGSGC